MESPVLVAQENSYSCLCSATLTEDLLSFCITIAGNRTRECNCSTFSPTDACIFCDFFFTRW